MRNKVIFASWLISMLSTPKIPECGSKPGFLEAKIAHGETLSLQISLFYKASSIALGLGFPASDSFHPNVFVCLFHGLSTCASITVSA